MSARLFLTSAIYPGVTSGVGYTITDALGVPLAARTTTGVTESPIGSGKFIARAALDSSWTGFIDWDDGFGNVQSDRFEGTTPPTGTVAPQPRRPFQFVHRLGSPSVLTDAASVVMSDPTNTFGARNIDTGAIVVPNNTPMTRVALGSYFWDVVEPGGNIEWYAKVTETALNGGGTFAYPFTSLDPTVTTHYASVPLLRLKLGQTNADAYAAGSSQDLESTGVQATIDAQEEYALTESDDRVNLKLIGAGVVLPFVAPSTYVTAQVRKAATAYAAGYVRKFRDDQAGTTRAANELAPGDVLIAEGDAIMDALVASGALTEEETDDVVAGSFQFSNIVRQDCVSVSDENSA